MSIRTKLTLWFTAVLLAGFVVFGAAFSIMLERHLLSGVDRRLRERSAGAQAVVAEEARRGPEHLREELDEYAHAVAAGTLIFAYDAAGRPLVSPDAAVASRAQACPAEAGAFGGRTMDGHRLRAFASTVRIDGQPYRFCVVTSLDAVDDTLRVSRLLLTALAPGVLVLAALGGFWISRRALSQVDRMTTVALSIGADNLTARLPVPPSHDELRRLARAWNEMLDRLQSAFERSTRFTADASHELRTPVALIRATAELALRRQRTAEEYRSALASIEAEAERLTEMSDNLLALARADSQGGGVKEEAIDLNQLAHEVANEVEPLASAKEIRVSVATGDQRLAAAGDPAALRRLLLILIQNALEHTPPGGNVSIETAQRNGSAQLMVSDSGEGIGPEHLPHIFERFYRGDPARGRGGAGLGLSIADAIARAHGGAIEAHSSVEKGSTFTVSLPVRPPASRS